MKLNKLIIYSGTLMSMVMASCASDYLDVEPVSYIPREDVFKDAKSCQLALDGLTTSLNTYYSNLDFNGNSGEAYVNTVCNDCFGPDVTSGLWSYYKDQYNWMGFDQARAYVNLIPWAYEYNLISQANTILHYIDEATGDEDQLKFIKASALTFRAHGYQKLLGWYGQRWQDTRNGEAYCIPLRLNIETGNEPLATHNQVYDQIYKDLDEAIALFKESSVTRSTKTEVNENVAYGIYARAALAKEDWATAQSMAANARKGFTIMDKQTVTAGFTNTCSDYIWNMDPSWTNTGYMSWGSHYTCNGAYVNFWQMGANGISIDLYRQLDENDIRREMFLTPDKVNQLNTIVENQGRITEADFWNENMVDENNSLNLAMTGPYTPNNAKRNPGMYNVALFWSYKYRENYVDYAQFANEDNFYDYFYEYLNQSDAPSSDQSKLVRLQNNKWGALVMIPFGAQYKFWGFYPYGNGEFPYMRASEMALIEAEAYKMMNKEAEAIACLTELNSKRIDGYTCTKSGDDLLNEIRVTRRIELWGEGHNFTDFKRWNVPMERRQWIPDDPTSGNFIRTDNTQPEGYALYVEPSAKHGWRFIIPFSETQYNTAIDMSLLNN